MLVLLTAHQHKLVPSKREDIACWRVSHARSPSILLPSQESMDLPRLLLSESTFSQTRSMKIQPLLQPLCMFQMSPRLNMKCWTLMRMDSSLTKIRKERWTQLSDYQKTMKKFTINFKRSGIQEGMLLSSFHYKEPPKKPNGSVEEQNDDYKQISLLFYLFHMVFCFIEDQQLFIFQAGSNMSGGSWELVWGCFSFMCCTKELKLPYDLLHPAQEQLNFLSTSLADRLIFL